MNVGYSGSADWGTGLALLMFSLAVLWVVIYTAVRAAIGHGLDWAKPRLVAEAVATTETVEFSMANVGPGTAVHVGVYWSDRPTIEALVRTPLLNPGAKLEWAIPAAAPAVGETQSLRTLRVDWYATPDQSFGRHTTYVAVLVPSRLDAFE